MRRTARSEAIKFLKRHVIGKTVIAEPITTSADRGHLSTAYEDQTYFTNLVETADGFSFDLTALSRGTRFVPVERGQAFMVAGTLDAIRVYRYEITERKSSGKLIGFARYISSTNTQGDPFSGTFFLSQISLKTGELLVQDTQAGYGDFVSAKDTRQPIASDGTYRYAIQRGKLVLYYQQTTYDVDPQTLRRTRRKDKFPRQVCREINFPRQK